VGDDPLEGPCGFIPAMDGPLSFGSKNEDVPPMDRLAARPCRRHGNRPECQTGCTERRRRPQVSARTAPPAPARWPALTAASD
jgi:hypothetical protein